MQTAIVTSALISIRICLPGLAWGWLLCRFRTEQPLWKQVVVVGSLSAVAGFFLAAASASALGYFGVYTPPIEWLVLGGGTAAGLCLGRRIRGHVVWAQVLLSLPVTFLLWIAFAVALWIPFTSEWLTGGWDPGVYTNEAIALSRTGSFHPPDSFFYSELTPTERVAFTRTDGNRTERFPGVLVDPAREAFTYEFFRLTPAAYAMFHRAGGMRAVTRANTFVGVLVLLCLFAFLESAGGLSHALFACAILLVQPIWLHHLHFPVSEMIHLLLICALMHVSDCGACTGYGRAGAGLVLFLLVLNRCSFVPFAGVWLVCAAVTDFRKVPRAPVFAQRFLQLSVVVLAAGINWIVAPTSIRGWTVLPFLLRATFGFVLCAVVIDGLGCIVRLRRKWAAAPAWFSWVRASFGMVAFAGLAVYVHNGARPQDADNVRRLLPFLGVAPVLAACAGGVILFGLNKPEGREMRRGVLFLLAVTGILLVRKNIVDWYPWATRRYLPYTIPLVAILGGYAVSRLWEARRQRIPMRVLALLALLVALGLNIKMSCHAWWRVEYQGLADSLASVAAQIGTNEVVVADHPWWGTPLALAHGKHVLNGRHLWRETTGRKAEIGVAALNRLREAGNTIKFLTSTEDGLAVYPLRFSEARLVWTSSAVSLNVLIQHPRAAEYEMKTKQKVFRLYEITGPLSISEAPHPPSPRLRRAGPDLL